MPITGRMLTGGDAGNRVKDDFYATPYSCTQALLSVEYGSIPGHVWEPACGDGAICDVLNKWGIEHFASDIEDRGYVFLDQIIDFTVAFPPPSNAIITNPPFNMAEAFIRRASLLGIDYMALLLKATFWHAAKRQELFELWKPARIYAITWRPDFLKKGAPTMDCIWCVWDGRGEDDPTYHLLRKP